MNELKHALQRLVQEVGYGARRLAGHLRMARTGSVEEKLLEAVFHGRKEQCLRLLDEGADPTAVDPQTRFNAPLLAVMNNDVELCMALVDRGADLSYGMPNAEAPLTPLKFVMIRNKAPALVAALLALGARVTQQERRHLDALRFTRLVELPRLHQAAASGHVPLVQRQLDLGDDPQTLCPRGRTAVETAFAYDQPRAGEFIRNWVASGRTPRPAPSLELGLRRRA